MITALLIFAGMFTFISSIFVDTMIDSKSSYASGWSIIIFLSLFLLLLPAIFGLISTTTGFIICGVAFVISLLRILNFKKVVQFIGKIGP
jgi:hypothetical protein